MTFDPTMNDTPKPFRAGDHVHHEPSGENWMLGVDEEDGRVMPCGWPATIADAKHCTLIKAATDGERMQMLCVFAKGGESDMRACAARRQLLAMKYEYRLTS